MSREQHYPFHQPGAIDPAGDKLREVRAQHRESVKALRKVFRRFYFAGLLLGCAIGLPLGYLLR
jgi:hypothetical protein